MKKIIKILIALILITSIIVFGAYYYYNQQINLPASDSDNIIQIEIEQNESVKDISVKLQTAGVIKSSDIFFLYVKLNQIASQIQAGKFQIPQNLTVIEVAEKIQKAAGNDIWITIQEGLRLDEIAETLDEYFLKEENTLFNKEEFLDIVNNPDNYELDSEDLLADKPIDNSLEGYIFPNTYNINKDITSLELTNLFLDTLENKLETESIDINSHQEFNSYEVIVLASIIEREARTSEERSMISDILQKRLRGELDGVKLLQADATLLYDLKDWEAVITSEIKENDSEYNTYKVTGLTPTPICNPGIDSIKAVLSPKENTYFFYLHDDKGKIHYAETNEEHVNNQRCFINKNSDYCL